jgi:ABC-type nitrate/sulfonate/bicarbonate transport system ATPase subunit
MAPHGISISIAEKRFGGGATLFTDLALKVAPGSTVALMGPSGIGKSSLLRLVAGIDTDFSGRIDIGGQAAVDAAMPGFVFQDPRLLPWISARDNVRIADRQMTVERADALLNQVGLGGRGADFPAQLSGGMQRRVALARALASNAQLLLLDEPFVSLDAALADEMRALLAAILGRGNTTSLLATHDPEDAARLADRVIVLAGRPAQVAADLALDVPPQARDAGIIADHQADIAVAARGLERSD